ncbi:MAG: signal peptide protein [Herbaspirillum sp.]|nr:signal peptide protein [Herbaspirillum sp.]
MCLIVFSWQVVPGLPLIVASNRDEFYNRPASPAGWWEDHPHVYAGRDLQGGGTWLGITRDGRFAALTNFRAPTERRSDAPTRGTLVSNYLIGSVSPQEYLSQLAPQAAGYNGFNLLIGDKDGLYWFSNKADGDPRNGQPLTAGIYGLSNALLDTPWPKVTRAKAQFCSLLCQGAPDETYFEMLTDTTLAGDCRLPKTGVSIERERELSPVFINSPGYGTRNSTLVRLYSDGRAVLTEQLIDHEAMLLQPPPPAVHQERGRCGLKNPE